MNNDPLELATQLEVNFDADLDCQVCGVYVAGGYYDGKSLKWRCPDGHDSIIEKFLLG